MTLHLSRPAPTLTRRTLQLTRPMSPGRITRLKEWGLAACHDEAREWRTYRIRTGLWGYASKA
jgi:hypothetical protein